MSQTYFTITGMNHYYGTDFMKEDMQVKIIKDLDNKYDSEAIKVELPGMGKIGYVANSPCTVLGESISAGRIYDRIGDEAVGRVLYILGGAVVCVLEEESTES